MKQSQRDIQQEKWNKRKETEKVIRCVFFKVGKEENPI